MTTTTIHIRNSNNRRLKLDSFLRISGKYFAQWRRNIRTRRELAKLDEHLLKDIGISRSDAATEANKPFWVK